MKSSALPAFVVAAVGLSSPCSAATYAFGFDGYNNFVASVYGAFTANNNDPDSMIVAVSGDITKGYYDYDVETQTETFVSFASDPITGLSSGMSTISGNGALLSLKFIANSMAYDLEITRPSQFPFFTGTLTDADGQVFTGYGSYTLTSLSAVPIPASMPMFGGALLTLAGICSSRWKRSAANA